MSRNGEPGEVARLTLYSKSDCELCHTAKTTLQGLSQELAFEVVEIDITTDPALYHAYCTEIPVGFLDGRKVFKYRVDPALLRQQLSRRQHGLIGRWFSSLRHTSS